MSKLVDCPLVIDSLGRQRTTVLAISRVLSRSFPQIMTTWRAKTPELLSKSWHLKLRILHLLVLRFGLTGWTGKQQVFQLCFEGTENMMHTKSEIKWKAVPSYIIYECHPQQCIARNFKLRSPNDALSMYLPWPKQKNTWTLLQKRFTAELQWHDDFDDLIGKTLAEKVYSRTSVTWWLWWLDRERVCEDGRPSPSEPSSCTSQPSQPTSNLLSRVSLCLRTATKSQTRFQRMATASSGSLAPSK